MKCLFFLSEKLNQQCCQIRESFGCFPISILFAEIEFRRYIIILWRQKQHTHAHHFLLSTFKQMRVYFVHICFYLLFLFFFLNSSERDDCCVFQHWLHTILSFSVNGDNVTLMLNVSYVCNCILCARILQCNTCTVIRSSFIVESNIVWCSFSRVTLLLMCHVKHEWRAFFL